VASPLGAAALLRRGNTASEHAVAAAIISSTLGLLLTVVVLSQSTYGQGSVHERNLFYVVPLLVICTFAWAQRGFPTSRRSLGATAGTFVGLALLMPPGVLEGSSVDALSFKFWTQLGPASVAGRDVIVLAFVMGAIVLAFARSTPLLLATFLVATLGVTSASNYHTDVPSSLTERYQWVDDVLPDDARATLLWIDCSAPRCRAAPAHPSEQRLAVYTELFNARVGEAAHIGEDNPSRGLATAALKVGADGTVLAGTSPLSSRYVILDARIAVKGARLAVLRANDVEPANSEVRGALALWRTDGRVQLLNHARGELASLASLLAVIAQAR
jgi:hypothetical protein